MQQGDFFCTEKLFHQLLLLVAWPQLKMGPASLHSCLLTRVSH